MGPCFQKPAPPLGPCSGVRPPYPFNWHSPWPSKPLEHTCLHHFKEERNPYLRSFIPSFPLPSSPPPPAHLLKGRSLFCLSALGEPDCLKSAGSVKVINGQGLGRVLPGSWHLNQIMEIKMRTDCKVSRKLYSKQWNRASQGDRRAGTFESDGRPHERGNSKDPSTAWDLLWWGLWEGRIRKSLLFPVMHLIQTLHVPSYA